MAGIRVGVATVDITPPLGLPLMGNYREDYAARGVHDPLFAKAIVFADESGGKAALLAVDVCMLDRENVAFMRQSINSQCDVPPDNVMIHATHTHSGPAISTRIGPAEQIAPDAADVQRFLTSAASAVAAANRLLGDATLTLGRSSEDRVSFHRRLQRHDGSTQMNWEALLPGFDPTEIHRPWGAIDPELLCVGVEQNGRLVGALVSFGLHPAILAGDNWLYSADYPGYLAEALARTRGSSFVSMFLNGCCGDVNHIDYRDPMQGRGYQMTQRVGYMLGAAAHQAMNVAQPMSGTDLRVSRQLVQLERTRIDDSERAWCERVLEEARQCPPQGQVDGLPDAYYAKLRLQMWQNQGHPDHVEVMAIRIGDVAVVGLPGEAFCQLGLEIKRHSPAAHTLVAGLCNDAIGYLPTRESFEQGGYETTAGSTFYAPGAGERLVSSALAQLERLFSTTPGGSQSQ